MHLSTTYFYDGALNGFFLRRTLQQTCLVAPSPASPSDISDANFEENNTLNDASALHNKQKHNHGYINEYAEYISSSLYCPYI